MSFLNSLAGKTFNNVGDQPASSYARLYAYNELRPRVKSIGAGGFFFIKESELMDPASPPWKLEEVQFRNGKDLGYVAQHIKAAIIGYRECWTRSEGETYQRFLQRQPGTKSRLEVLAIVQGLEEPVSLIFKTYSAGNIATFLKRRYPVFLKDAARKAGCSSLPLWTFWVPLGPQLDEDGDVLYRDTGHGSTVTPLAVHWPKGNTEEIADALGVSEDILTYGEELREDAQDWLHEWQTRTAAATEEVIDISAPIKTDDNRAEKIEYAGADDSDEF